MTIVGDIINFGDPIPEDVTRLRSDNQFYGPVDLCLVVEVGNGDVSYWIGNGDDQWGDEDIPDRLYPLKVMRIKEPSKAVVPAVSGFITKDSGRREQFDSGMQRDTQDGKPRFDLMFAAELPYEEQLITRYAVLLARGAHKYTERNWEQATGRPELERAKASALRHMAQWMCGETDEDHAAAVIFNLTVAEYVRWRMRTNDDNADRQPAIGSPVTVPREPSPSGYDHDNDDRDGWDD